MAENHVQRPDCPLNKEELGNHTWGFLHSMAAHYPAEPTHEDQREMSLFFTIFAKFYPCPTCRQDFATLLVENPPHTESQEKLSQWLCWAHNQVNIKLGKPIFDCSKVEERWRSGWKDGSCD